MNPSRNHFSAIEICVAALYVWMAFFAATALSNVFFGANAVEAALVTVAGCGALGVLLWVWLRQHDTRDHPVNLVLIAVAGFIGLDVAAALTA